MLSLINTNRMTPPIAPLGLAYVAAAARAAGIETEVVDLCLADDPARCLAEHFGRAEPALVGLSFRNVDDCFWPSGKSFLPELAETIGFMEGLDADAIGAPLGLRICPELPIVEVIAAEGPMEANPAVRRHYDGPVDLLLPTFYISAALGEAPAALVRELIGDDERFFKPALATDAPGSADGDHNYNDNAPLAAAIAAGARGAYWHILRQMG